MGPAFSTKWEQPKTETEAYWNGAAEIFLLSKQRLLLLTCGVFGYVCAGYPDEFAGISGCGDKTICVMNCGDIGDDMEDNCTMRPCATDFSIAAIMSRHGRARTKCRDTASPPLGMSLVISSNSNISLSRKEKPCQTHQSEE